MVKLPHLLPVHLSGQAVGEGVNVGTGVLVGSGVIVGEAVTVGVIPEPAGNGPHPGAQQPSRLVF